MQSASPAPRKRILGHSEGLLPVKTSRVLGGLPESDCFINSFSDFNE
jgi:hypothetical protein